MDVQMAEVARILGVSRQLISMHLDKLTHRRLGKIVLMNPDVVKHELAIVSRAYAAKLYHEMHDAAVK